MTSVANESVLSDELTEETKEFLNNNEPKKNNLTVSIHMPNLNQLDESKVSFQTKPGNSTSRLEKMPATDASNEKVDIKNLAVGNENIENITPMMADKHTKAPINTHENKSKQENLNSVASNGLWPDNSADVKSQTLMQSNMQWSNGDLSKPYRKSLGELDMKRLNSSTQGQPVRDVGYTYRINPAVNQEFAYMNRNKLVNRRISIKKQNEISPGLPALGKIGSGKNQPKLVTDFALGSEKMLDEFVEQENLNDDMNSVEVNLTPETFGYYKNITSKLIENIKPKNSNQRRRQHAGLKQAKSSSIIILEREKSMTPAEGPSPASYHIPRRPLNEKKSPMYTIGKRCFNEKGGGGRTSWEKEWFTSKNPFIIKSDFRRELFWPTPANYRIKSSIGIESNKAVYYQFPTHSIPKAGAKIQSASRAREIDISQANSQCIGCHHQNIMLSRDDLIEKDMKKYNVNKDFHLNDPNSARDQLHLDVITSSDFIAPSAPKVGFKFRERGTELWESREKTPGPGAYDHNKFENNSRFNKSPPKFSVAQSKHCVNYNTGPYAAL